MWQWVDAAHWSRESFKISEELNNNSNIWPDTMQSINVPLFCLLSGEEDAGRRQWVNCPPNSLLKALAQAQLTSSTLDSVAAGQSSLTHSYRVRTWVVLQGFDWKGPSLSSHWCVYSQIQGQSRTEQRRRMRGTPMWRWTKSAWSRDQMMTTRTSTLCRKLISH